MTNRYQLLAALASNSGASVKLRTQYIERNDLTVCEVIAANPVGYWHVACMERGEAIYTERPVVHEFVAQQVSALGVPDKALWGVGQVNRSATNPWGTPPPSRRVSAAQDVYFIQSVAGGPIKIGCSDAPEARLSQLQTGSPFKLEIVGVVPDGGRKLEGELHKKFAGSRSHGEWFFPTPELVTYVAPWRR